MPAPGSSPSPVRLQVGDLVGIQGKAAEAKAPLIAVVSSIQGGKLELRLAASSKVLSLPPRQVELLAPCPEPGMAAALDPSRPPWNLTVEALAQAAPKRADLAAAWQVAVAERSPDAEELELSLEAFAELVCGHGDPLRRCACWLWLQSGQTLFRLKQGRIIPRRGEELRRIRQERHRLRLADAQRSSWIRALKQRDAIDPAGLGDKQRQDLGELRRWAAGDRDFSLPDDLKHLLQQVRCSTEPAEVRHLLADVGLWPRHHLPSFEGTCWHQGFSEELLALAGELANAAEGPLPGDAHRLDLTSLHAITIDDDDTLEIDDGLSVEWRAEGGPRIWIHIADPGRLIAAESPLDLEARRRGTSLYLAQGSLPMFPEVLAHGPFSLRAGHRCAAWSLAIDLAPDGAISEMTPHRSWVRPAYRMSYADVDELLELAPPQERELLTMHELLGRRRSWRAARGAIFLDQAEGRIRRVDATTEGDQARLEIIEPSAARLMVAEAMILAGAAVAHFGQLHHLALPYRGQPAGPIPTAQDLEALPAGPARLAAVRKCLTRGVVSTTAQPHFSLGLTAYVQATSPIRRYGDLLVQRQLACHLEGRSPLEAMALSDLLSSVEGGLREGMAISREDQRHWRQVWFSQHRGQQWRGVFLRWLREEHHLALVHLESLAMDLPADCRGTPQPGDVLLVRLREVDALRDLLRLDARCL